MSDVSEEKKYSFIEMTYKKKERKEQMSIDLVSLLQIRFGYNCTVTTAEHG
jgi:hypothetical protein